MIRRHVFATVVPRSWGTASAWRRSRAARSVWIGLIATATLLAPTLAAAAVAAAQPGWSRTADMAVARQMFPAVTLESGQVLVASGSSAQLFDPVSETFSEAGTLTVDRGYGFSATLLGNGNVLLTGGGGFSSALTSAELYEPASGTFTPTGDMTVPRSFHTATLLADGRVLVAGGSRSGFPESSVASAEIYDPVSGTFAPTGGMTAARQDHTATLLGDGRILVAGGYEAGGFRTGLVTAEVYDPSTETFTDTGNMATGHGHHTATALGNGTVLIAGGFTEFPGPSVASAELYDPSNGTFTPTGDMHDPRGWHTATPLKNGTVLLAGGFTAFPFTGTTLASAEIYDPSTASFTLTASMHSARGRYAAAQLPNGNVLVAGGLTAQCCDATNTAEVYSLTLVDTRPPTITTPGDLTVIATGPEGAAVSYSVSATDNVDDNPQLTCQPPSESTFPVGVTSVGCTATDSSGNTSSANFTVTVLTPLDIGLSLDRSGIVNKKTGVASVGGSVACNRATHVFISGELKQTVANRAQVDGFFSTELDCSPPAVAWNATVTPTTGRYNAGNADASAGAFACDEFSSCDSDQAARSIKLTGH